MKSIKLKNDDLVRLDKALAEVLDVSRVKIQKAIKQGSVLVDGAKCTIKQLVNSENEINVNLAAFTVEPHGQKAPKLDIIYEDPDVLVINKPSGLLVHATESSNEPTLVDALIEYNSDISNVGEDRDRAGLVHRLDKPASGVMIVAKTNNAFEHLKKQFQNRETEKKYTVLIRGNLQEPFGTITLPISRAKKTGRMAAKPASQGGKEAITHYELITQYPHHALVDVTIETGRTHQIRAHFFAIGHQVVGDTLYKQKGLKPMNIKRLFLHARELTITLPNGNEETFTAPLPPELQSVLETIPKL